MYSRQTKDNKKWCDLANLTNVYNSDNIHHNMVDNILEIRGNYSATWSHI